MVRTDRLNSEQGTGWQAFMKAMHANSDPKAAQLMDDFRKVAHQFYQLNEISLESTGLSYAQFRVLMGLQYCEWAGGCDGLNPSEISAQQGTSRNTISALIRSLEDEGLVERHLNREDRRRFNIHLTDAGRRIVLDHASQHGQFVTELFAVLDEDQMNSLSTLLQILNHRAQELREAVSHLPRR